MQPILPTYPITADRLENVMCERLHCVTQAGGWLDGVPYCFDCVELIIDREAALDIDPWLPLPALDDHA